ncbi:PH domain-containing protein [Rubrobacter aplysinae]|uniref:PH domain-containing protein n=1 Tax=Rubrobacter aplysinae TaxID=909625 RepID=UPI00064BAA2B|nr:PH domain-containing protein [Rubrobacter aplysinae]
MEDRPIAQATGSSNNIVEVYPRRMELHSGWQNKQTETLDLRDVSAVSVKGFVNCTLTVQTNKGRQYKLERLSLPEARGIKKAVESQKQKAGLYE